MRGWLELPVMEQPRKGLSFWSVTGKTLDVRSQGDQSHLAFLLRKDHLSETTLADKDDVRYSIREGAAGSASQGHTWSRGGQKGGLQQGVCGQRRNQQVSIQGPGTEAAPAPQKVFLLLSFLPTLLFSLTRSRR